MALVLEDGTGVVGANSYATEDMTDVYFDDRGNATWTGSTDSDAKEAALVRATAALDMIYRGRYPGTRVDRRDQALEWPRTNATDVNGELIAIDEVPIEVRNATMELALRELVEAGSAAPDVDPRVRSIRAGSVHVMFAANGQTTTAFTIVSDIMANLVGGGNAGSLVGEASRG